MCWDAHSLVYVVNRISSSQVSSQASLVQTLKYVYFLDGATRRRRGCAAVRARLDAERGDAPGFAEWGFAERWADRTRWNRARTMGHSRFNPAAAKRAKSSVPPIAAL